MTGWHAGDEAIAAILAARHEDPFALLGPHEVAGGIVIRAFVPGADTLTALVGDDAWPLERRSEAGFFEGFRPGAARPRAYRLRATRGDDTWEFLDPYAFGPTLGPLDDHLLVEGTHARLFARLGAHPCDHEGAAGVRFAVWAPEARRVSVVGDFNAWDGRRHPMRKRVDSGLWEIFLPGLAEGVRYKYEILGRDGAVCPLKADPFGFAAELRPATASVVARTDRHAWADAGWMARRAKVDARRAPMTIYEVHAGSWRRHPDGRFYSWDELADALIPYVADLGFTHVELMPISEHPLDASWGYQPIGLYAVTARHGPPEGLARLIDRAHAAGIGVILDWVPAHFPLDAPGLARFDGGPLYEHPDPRRGFLPGWGTAVFDFGRKEVAAFLAANALFWLNRYHADGLRVDAVSSMLYLDYDRPPDGWAPNEDGSNVNREAVAFLQHVNALIAREAPGALTCAEEASAWPGITAPPGGTGLGFRFKWNMGWMNDTLRYVAKEAVHRRWHHDLVTFGLMYAWNEAFILPLSHDEVVHGKGTLLGRLPGDDWQRFATLRCLYAHMWGHPGKKLLFMGQEFGPWREWSEERECDWWLLQHAPHRGLQDLVRALNRLHRDRPALHARDCEPEGFRWIEADDAGNSVFSWLRFDGAGGPPVAVVTNFTPLPRQGYRIGLPVAGAWRVVLNTDGGAYGGSGAGAAGEVVATADPLHGLPASAAIDLPPLGALYLEPVSWTAPGDA
ncbi:1,4-alpha-glucan branching protein GlgB [Neoroseomonas oryzicola]|uniref:1,4-alpha-glucan branching enzyme GlgB n=1 Tax=Neoroseomonas oryzicola TaxID=535904 RepID=A0A9X9WC02_9PROT|nr:1,4-alpha-glucan branching protein GlgB [Neoroseomonas oryzicola]MBR0657862.1 1,4-alpha-glucan branching protein GlgB [Neoroseomonas oryzicola]NKE18570.1 1,4-alpha-glucan branching protein GlgB [Neoroseomonas oryzicola]